MKESISWTFNGKAWTVGWVFSDPEDGKKQLEGLIETLETIADSRTHPDHARFLARKALGK